MFLRATLLVGVVIGSANANEAPAKILLKNQGSAVIFDAGTDQETAFTADSSAHTTELMMTADTSYDNWKITYNVKCNADSKVSMFGNVGLCKAACASRADCYGCQTYCDGGVTAKASMVVNPAVTCKEFGDDTTASCTNFFAHNPKYRFTQMLGTATNFGSGGQTVSTMYPGQKLWNKAGTAFARLTLKGVLEVVSTVSNSAVWFKDDSTIALGGLYDVHTPLEEAMTPFLWLKNDGKLALQTGCRESDATRTSSPTRKASEKLNCGSAHILWQVPTATTTAGKAVMEVNHMCQLVIRDSSTGTVTWRSPGTC